MDRIAKSTIVRGLFVLAAAGCADTCNNDDTSTPNFALSEGGPTIPIKTLSPTCGEESTFVVVSYTGFSASSLGDTIIFPGGVEVKGTKTYDAAAERWTVGAPAPKGVTSGPITVKSAGEVIELGTFTVPCPEGGPPPQNAFEPFRGNLTVGAGCDDANSQVTLENFTSNSFTMTGLADNGPITFNVNGTKATAFGVSQFGKPGHTVTLEIADGKISMGASSPDGSCTATLSKQ